MQTDAGINEQLLRVTDALHDQWFEVSDIEYDKSARTVRVPFSPSARRPTAEESRRWILEVLDVSKCVVEESEDIGRYDFNKIEYVPAKGRLTIHTGIPVTFYMDVDSVQVAARERGRA